MRILDVIPIARGIGTETLSYFSAKDAPIGSIVSVPVRKKGVSAIVVASHDIHALKADIKDADFKLRNVLAVHRGTLFFPEFIKTCVLIKNYLMTTTSSILASMVPKLFIDEYLESARQSELMTVEKSDLMPEKFIFQAPYDERISYYKTYIRQEFANKQSVFIAAPTIAAIEHLAEELQKGIIDRVFVFHSGLTKKRQRERYEAVLRMNHPVVIIATPSYLFLPRTDVSTVIVEEEGSSHYRQYSRPFLDKRDFLYVFAHTRGIKYIAADQLLRVETLHRAKDEHFGEIKPLSFHIPKSSTSKIVSMKPAEDADKKEFAVFSNELIDLLKKIKKEQQHIVLLVGRKGLAPITACQDCGSVQCSPDSGAPLVLYIKKDAAGRKRALYQCPITQTMYDTIDKCQKCDSWKLKLLGIGIDTVIKQIETDFPKLPLTIVDSERTKTHTSTKKAVDGFLAKKSGVLIATQKVIPYIHEQVDHIAVVSIDSFFSVPSFIIQEKIMRLLLALQSKTKNELLIQTRDPEQLVLKEIKKGNIIDFYRSEIRDRKLFHYPPFGLLLEVNVTATTTTIAKKRNHLQTLFEAFNATIITQPGERKGVMIIRAIMKIPGNEWIRKTSSKNPGETFKKLFSVIDNLPQSYNVVINPERI